MEFLFSMLGAFLGLILAVIAIIIVVLVKVRASLGKTKFREIIKAAKNAKELELGEYSRQKDVVRND